MADETTPDEGPRKLDVETRKMQAALIGTDIAAFIKKLPDASTDDIRDAIRRFIVIGPPKNIMQLEDQADEMVLLAVLDRFDEKPWLCFAYRPMDSKEGSKPKSMKIRIEPRDSAYFIGLLRRILSNNYKRLLAERDIIGLEAMTLEGRKRKDVERVTSLRDIIRRGPAK